MKVEEYYDKSPREWERKDVARRKEIDRKCNRGESGWIKVERGRQFGEK